MKDFATIANRLLSHLEVSPVDKNDETKGTYVSFTYESIKNMDEPFHRAISDLLYSHCDVLSSDCSYEWLYEYLTLISDTNPTQLDDLPDTYADGVAIYTSDLTQWLAQHINHVYWLDEALRETLSEHGAQLLTNAQCIARRYFAYAVNDMIEKLTP